MTKHQRFLVAMARRAASRARQLIRLGVPRAGASEYRMAALILSFARKTTI